MATIKTKDWPLPVKDGSTVLKIYKTVDRGRDRYTVIYHEGPKRCLRQFADVDEAKKEAKEIATKLNAGRGAALELDGGDRDAYLHAIGKLREFKTGLVPAINEYIEAKKYGVPLAVAAREYKERNSKVLPERTVSQVYEEMMEDRKRAGAGETYLIDLKSRLGRFARDFKDQISAISAHDITTWIHSLGLSPRSKRNFHSTIVSLFLFARDEKGYLNKDRKTEAELAKKVKVKSSAITFFSPQEFARLLSVADDGILPFFVFGGFCGLRSIEIKRLKWEDVHWNEGVVYITKETAKQGEARRSRRAPLPHAMGGSPSVKPNRHAPLTPILRMPGDIRVTQTPHQPNIIVSASSM